MTETTHLHIDKITGVILSGGKATRMGHCDKGLMCVNKQPLMSYIIDTLAPQVSDIIINANRNIEEYEKFKYRVVSDLCFDKYSFDKNSSDNNPDDKIEYLGPLAGMLVALTESNTDYIVTVPCDTPNLSPSLVEKLLDNLDTNNNLIPCVANDGNRLQPLFSILHKDLIDSLQDYLKKGERKAEIWFKNQKAIIVDFSEELESFENINTLDELSLYETRQLKKS